MWFYSKPHKLLGMFKTDFFKTFSSCSRSRKIPIILLNTQKFAFQTKNDILNYTMNKLKQHAKITN